MAGYFTPPMDSPGSTPSAPLSPTTTMTSTHSDTTPAMHDHPRQSPTTATVDNSLDDIFGSSPPPSSEANPPLPAKTPAEPSDLPSLRRQHVTAGYRDGISASKGEHVQNGFDAGFPVGGQLGMRAGTVLGILEGVLRGYESRAASAVVKKQLPAAAAARGSSTGTGTGAGRESEEQKQLRRNQRERVLKLYQRALKELEVQSVFGVMEDNGDEEKPEAQLARKGDNIISKLEDRVRVAHWEQNMEALEEKEKEVAEDGNTQRS